jgi:hypothetical protein
VAKAGAAAGGAVAALTAAKQHMLQSRNESGVKEAEEALMKG